MTTKQKTPALPDNILGIAVLSQLHMGVWEARKHDREVTAKVNREVAHNPQAGRYHKHLFGGTPESLGRVFSAASRLRDAHLTQTLPWTDKGWRILPSANYMQYQEALRPLVREFEEAVETFVADYPKLRESAKGVLNGMYRAADYPDPRAVRRKFYAQLDYSPVPAGEDFRTNLPKAELARMAKSVEQRRADAVRGAMEDAWQRLGDAITELRDRLDDGKNLRDTMIERLREVAEVLGRLNITNDPVLEKARTEALDGLTKKTADQLKDDELARKEAAKKADAILKTMKGLYAPSKKEEDK